MQNHSDMKHIIIIGLSHTFTRVSSHLHRLAAIFMLLFCFIVSIGATTYKLTAVTSVSAGNKYVFVEDGYALSNTITSNSLDATNSYSSTGLTGSESYVWTLESSTNGFLLKNPSRASNYYLRNSDSNGTSVAFSTNSEERNEWNFNFSEGLATISCYTNSRILGNTGSHTYKAYASPANSYPHAFTVYILEAEGCTAPDHVNITGRWDRFGGETISLTATAYDSSDDEIDAANITGYQWQKYISSSWTDIDSEENASAATNNLVIEDCTQNNSGSYRCIVSTGEECETASDGHQVKVYVLECYTGGTTEHYFTRIGDSQSGSLQIDLTASTNYAFKVHADNDYYGNNGTIRSDVTNWVCSTSQGNLTIQSGSAGGTFTINIDYSTSGNSSVEGEPELSVIYPKKRIYMRPSPAEEGWLKDNPKFFIHSWGMADHDVLMTAVSVCEPDVYYADIYTSNTYCLFTRQNPSDGSINTSTPWNKSSDITISTNNYFYNSGWSADFTGGSFTPATYTISFDAGDGTGSMSAIEDIECDADQALPACTFEKSGYVFAGWHANVDVTVNNSTINAGYDIDDEATLQNIQRDITLTAQWEKEILNITFSPSSGSARKPNTPITLTSNDGATIYYTIDGSTPTTGSTVYSGPILIDGSVTIKALATKTDCDNSDVASATYTYEKEFVLATSSTTFTDGDEIVITNTGSTKALSTNQTANNRSQTSVTASDGKITITETNDTVQIILMESSSTNWMLSTEKGQYLYAPGNGSGNNYLRTHTTANNIVVNSDVWTISIDASDQASIIAQGENSNTNMRFYSTTLVSCYSTTTGTSPKIYCYHHSEAYIRCFHNLLPFKYPEGYGPSLAQAIEIKGYNLEGNLTVACPTGYELSTSLSSNSFTASNLTLTRDGNNRVSTTIYVRLAAGKSDGNYNQILSITGGGITNTNIPLTGIVSDVASGTMYRAITDEDNIFPYDEMVLLNDTGTWIMSTTQNTNNRGATNSGYTFHGNAVFVSGVSVQTITTEESGTNNRWLFKVGANSYLYAASSSNNQLKSKAAPGADGQWKIETSGLGTATICAPESSNRDTIQFDYNGGSSIFSCYSDYRKGGSVILYYRMLPNIWPNSSMTEFSTTTGAGPSDSQSFTFKAKNITSGNVTVSAPDNFEVCLSADGTYTSSVTVSPDASNYIDETTVYVRMKDVEVASPSGDITLSATGATDRTVAVSGSVTPLNVTYHAAGQDDYIVNTWYNGSVDAYAAENCADDRVFVGWSNAEVATTQTEPSLITRDGSLDGVTEDTELYAVFANRNGSGGHDYADNFNSYTTTTSYGSSHTYGIWNVTNGTASSINDVTTKMGSNAIVLQNKNATMATTQKIHNFTGLTCKIATTDNSVYFKIEYSTNGTIWTKLTGPTTHLSVRSAQTYIHYKTGDPLDAYVRFIISDANSGQRIYIDDVTIYSKPHDWVLTNYSTNCDDAPESVTVTFDKDEGTGDVPSSPAVGGSIVLPSLVRSNYRLDGYTVTLAGQEGPVDGIYYVGERFLVNYDVTLTAQWTSYFEDMTGVSPLTSGNGISVRSSEADSIVVNSATAGTPTANKSGTDAALFDVTIDAANKRVSDGKTHFPYYVSYTPTGHHATHSVQISFTSDGITSEPISVYGRSLPEEFVIAVRSNDGKWYALPNTIQDNSNAIPPTRITVDDETAPSQAIYAPTTTIYQTTGRYSSGSNTYGIRLTDPEGHWLQVSGSSGTNYVWVSGSGSSTCQDWLLSSSDLRAYTLTVPSSGAGDKKFGIYGGNIGYYSSPTSGDVYFLPITHPLTPRDAAVTEWGQHSVILSVDASAISGAKAHVENGAETSKQAITPINTTASSAKNFKVPLGDIDLADLANNEGKLLYIDWLDGSDDVIATSCLTIPRIIASSRNMYKEGETTKGVWNSEVYVLPGATLTANTGSYSPSGATIKELHIYPGATLNITTGTLTATTLRLHNGWTRAGAKQYNTARVYIADDAALVKTTASIDFDIYDQAEGRHYYPMAVPFETSVRDIDYADPMLAGFSLYGSDGQYVIKHYDGDNRARNGEDSQNNWDVVSDDASIVPGEGYIITAVPVKGEAIIRIPMNFDNAWTADGEKATATYNEADHTKNVVAVTAYDGTAAMQNKRHAGWNMLGVPYMSCYTTDGEAMTEGEPTTFIRGRMVITGGDDAYGGYDDEIIYVTVPAHDFSEYIQSDIGETTLLPGWPFMVQIGTSGNLRFITSAQTAAASLRATPYSLNDTTHTPLRTAIRLSNDHDTDKTTLIISDRYSSDYEIGADLEKMFGSGYTLALYSVSNGTRLAFQAMSRADALNVIPLGFRAPSDGQYTFSLHNGYADRAFQRVDLIDYQAGTLTNLLNTSYTFFSSRTQDDTRFALHIVPTEETPTDTEPCPDTSEQDKTVYKRMINNRLYIIQGQMIFDVTGNPVKGGLQ